MDNTPSERITVDGADYTRSDILASMCTEQYRVGLAHGINSSKNKTRTAIIETLRDTVRLQGVDIDEAQNLLDAILHACDMEAGTLTSLWTVYATLDGMDFHDWESVEAGSEEEAIDEVRESFTVSDVTLSVSFSTTQGYEDAEISGYNFFVEHALDWSAVREDI
jgi:hypothetical protein